jgi:sugar transferase EpsL
MEKDSIFHFFPPGIPVTKRVFDLAVSIPALALLSPVIAITALLIELADGKPVLFRQPRPGYRGKIFTVFKFRTMREAFDKDGQPLPDAKRMLPLGHFLRAASIDELPELVNIIRGEMSLVGPRPLLVEYLDRYTPEQMRRHDVLPGVTGWAQIHGRNILAWEDKFTYDVWYVDHWSFWLDIKILFMTLWKVIKREGISEPGQATSRKFQG